MFLKIHIRRIPPTRFWYEPDEPICFSVRCTLKRKNIDIIFYYLKDTMFLEKEDKKILIKNSIINIAKRINKKDC